VRREEEEEEGRAKCTKISGIGEEEPRNKSKQKKTAYAWVWCGVMCSISSARKKAMDGRNQRPNAHLLLSSDPFNVCRSGATTCDLKADAGRCKREVRKGEEGHAQRQTQRERERGRERRGTERENKGESGSDGYQVCGRKLSCGYISSPKRQGGTQRITTRNRRRTELADSRQKNIRRIYHVATTQRDRRVRCRGKYPPVLILSSQWSEAGGAGAVEYPPDLLF
jgi:hypothetical protein